MNINWSNVLTDLTYIVTAASAASAVLPKGEPGSWWAKVRKVINVAAANVANAKNHGE